MDNNYNNIFNICFSEVNRLEHDSEIEELKLKVKNLKSDFAKSKLECEKYTAEIESLKNDQLNANKTRSCQIETTKPSNQDGKSASFLPEACFLCCENVSNTMKMKFKQIAKTGNFSIEKPFILAKINTNYNFF